MVRKPRPARRGPPLRSRRSRTGRAAWRRPVEERIEVARASVRMDGYSYLTRRRCAPVRRHDLEGDRSAGLALQRHNPNTHMSFVERTQRAHTRNPEINTRSLSLPFVRPPARAVHPISLWPRPAPSAALRCSPLRLVLCSPSAPSAFFHRACSTRRPIARHPRFKRPRDPNSSATRVAAMIERLLYLGPRLHRARTATATGHARGPAAKSVREKPSPGRSVWKSRRRRRRFTGNHQSTRAGNLKC